MNTLGWGLVTPGLNGSQANIVGLNQLYSGATSPLCLANPEFTFSYASGVGPVATSPSISLDGNKIAYVENDPNIGAIFHVLTIAHGSTEYGSVAPTTLERRCARRVQHCSASVIPGSTAGSTATDYMLPLGLLRGSTAGGSDSYSSPFIRYDTDVAYVGDDSGYLYAITPIFYGSNPAQAVTGFPATVSANKLSAPVVDVSGTGNIFVGDSGGFLYNYTSAGTPAATSHVLTAGTATGGGVRDAPIVDSTSAVGYVVTPCTSAGTTEPLLTQFGFTAATLVSKATSSLYYTAGETTGCGNTTQLQMYDPELNNDYYAGGIGAAGAAITACFTNSTGNNTSGTQILETLDFTRAAY